MVFEKYERIPLLAAVGYHILKDVTAQLVTIFVAISSVVLRDSFVGTCDQNVGLQKARVVKLFQFVERWTQRFNLLIRRGHRNYSAQCVNFLGKTMAVGFFRRERGGKFLFVPLDASSTV